jgi:hypothetical protein
VTAVQKDRKPKTEEIPIKSEWKEHERATPPEVFHISRKNIIHNSYGKSPDAVKSFLAYSKTTSPADTFKSLNTVSPNFHRLLHRRNNLPLRTILLIQKLSLEWNRGRLFDQSIVEMFSSIIFLVDEFAVETRSNNSSEISSF